MVDRGKNQRIYSGVNPEKYAIMSSLQNDRIWSWRKLQKISVGDQVSEIIDKVESVFLKDKDITFVKRHDEFPF